MHAATLSLVLIALLPAFAAATAALGATRAPTVAATWRVAHTASLAMVAGAVLAMVIRGVDGASAGGLIRLDTVGVAMISLIALVGWVVIRYSATYLAGERDQARYAQRLLTVLAAVSVVVVANHLLLLVVAWTAASIGMHGLLTHFRDRPVAVAVAHKKFLFARCADAAMLGAVVAFLTTYDTLRIDAIAAGAAGQPLPVGARIGILLIAVAALLKTAQLPFHGWLLQVMEAPTPVSALLHAGVVNLGGFVLLRFAPLVDAAVETRTLLVMVGLTTAVIASLVMTTRVSVKVALAWSTCAQMGFMLMQCGLGLWQMALLHLLAHSVYKAHAFLSAGTTVRQTQRARLGGRAPIPTLRAVAAGATITALATAGVSLGWQWLPGTEEISATVWVMLGVVALAATPFVTPLGVPAGRSRAATPAFGVFGVPLAYLALHELFGRIVPSGRSAPTPLLVLVGAGFATVFVLQSACQVAPAGRIARRTRPWIDAGFFLDEAITRVAFAIWPPPPATPRPQPLPRRHSIAVVRTARVDATADPSSWATSVPTGSDAS